MSVDDQRNAFLSGVFQGMLAVAGTFRGATDLDPTLQGTGEGHEDGFVATLVAERPSA